MIKDLTKLAKCPVLQQFFFAGKRLFLLLFYVNHVIISGTKRRKIKKQF